MRHPRSRKEANASIDEQQSVIRMSVTYSMF